MHIRSALLKSAPGYVLSYYLLTLLVQEVDNMMAYLFTFQETRMNYEQ